MENEFYKQRPIDKLRDGAFSMKIRTPDDESAISEMISTGDRMLILKGKGIYETKLADEVDPERTNIDVPNTIQRVIPFGTDSAWVGAVVLTAYQLFHSSISSIDIDREKAFAIVLEMAQDIAGAYQVEAHYRDAVEVATENLDLKIPKDRSFVVPAIGNVGTRCSEFLQRADHTLQKLFRLVQMFYSDVGSGGWDSLKKRINDQDRSIDNFPQFLDEVIPFLQLIRNARNCAEHPRKEQKIVATDFSLDSKNMLLPPMIEIVHPRTPNAGIPVAEFFGKSLQRMVTVVELMMAFLCARNVKSFGGLEVQVIEIPSDRRRFKHVRYGYGAIFGDQITPIG